MKRNRIAGRLARIAADMISRDEASSMTRQDRLKAAGDRGADPDLLAQLVRDADEDVYEEAMENLGTPRGALEEVARGGDRARKTSLIAHAKESPFYEDLLEIMSDPKTEKDADVRRMVAMSPEISRETMAAMASDPEERVRMALAGNGRLDGKTMLILVRDGSAEVRLELALNDRLTDEAREMLRRDSDRGVREAVR